VLSVAVPTWRATKDISIKDDLVEEVGRMIGYGSITPVPPLVAAKVPPENRERAFHHRMRDLMVDQGFTEVYNYSFLSDETATRFGTGADESIRLANPIAAGQDLMRSSLLPGIWNNVIENAKHFEAFRLFEIGHEIHKREAELPDEIPHLTAAMYAKAGDGRDALFELKRVAICLAAEVEVEPAEARAWEHPARAGRVLLHGVEIGRLFEFHPSLVETGRAAVLDIDLRELEQQSRRPVRYAPIRRYPTSAFDLSVVTELRRPVGVLQAALTSLAGTDLVSIEFLRQYTGAPLPEDAKSVSFRLTVGSAERTLSSEEVGAVRSRIIEGMRGLGYDLRV
jgi:phenylalanyl-tRNA synthetase beta chain